MKFAEELLAVSKLLVDSGEEDVKIIAFQDVSGNKLDIELECGELKITIESNRPPYTTTTNVINVNRTSSSEIGSLLTRGHVTNSLASCISASGGDKEVWKKIRENLSKINLPVVNEHIDLMAKLGTSAKINLFKLYTKLKDLPTDILEYDYILYRGIKDEKVFTFETLGGAFSSFYEEDTGKFLHECRLSYDMKEISFEEMYSYFTKFHKRFLLIIQSLKGSELEQVLYSIDSVVEQVRANSSSDETLRTLVSTLITTNV